MLPFLLPLLLHVLAARAADDPCLPTCEPARDLAPALQDAPPRVEPLAAAEELATALDRGIWDVVTRKKNQVEKVKAWTDLAVRNDGGAVHGAWVRVTSRYANGAEETFLHRLTWKERMADGRERWGTSDVELRPRHEHHGKLVSAEMTFGVLVDRDGDGVPEPHVSDRVYSFANAADLVDPSANLGAPAPGDANLDRFRPAPSIPAPSPSVKGVPPTRVLFAPYDDPQAEIQARIDEVIRAKRDDPKGLHTIHASIYNLNDPRITDRLIEAHAAGVEVRLLTDAAQMDPRRGHQTEYRRLQKAGVEVVGVVRTGEFASNHTKFAVFDGKVATTGSYNWERQSNDDNNENLLVFASPEVAAGYERLFEAVAGGVVPAPPADRDAPFNVYYSGQGVIPSVLHRELSAAKKEIVVSMFTLRHLPFSEGGQQKDVLDALVEARRRGVEVTVLLEKNISDAGEYYGRVTPDDPTDEWLAAQGIRVVEIHTNQNQNQYAAMHHKFAVVDGETTLTGSYNWFPGSEVSDDDLVVLRDRTVASRYLGEVTNLRSRHDPTFDRASARPSSVTFQTTYDRTRPGEQVFVVGDIPELGGWDEARAVPLAADGWPTWSGGVQIPAGVNFQYKYLVKRGDRVTWEGGANHAHTARPEGGDDPVQDTWR